MNDEDLNCTPEQRVTIPEGQEYLGGTGITSMQFMKAHPVLTIAPKDNIEANSIVFFAGQGNEMMRINPEGFFWKGKLVENDKEIYLKVKEFFNTPRK